ncbi:MAG: hypothetical protein CMK07_12665 [Ponticaulis sp.]|nr:hypothetical protein [Ponticaulis sp.]
MTKLSAPFLALAACCFAVSCTPKPETEFWERLNALCGNTYDGKLVSDDPQDIDFRGADLWMDVSECSGNTVVVDFMNGDEAVGHWHLTRHEEGIELRHVHGGDAVTGYGGYSTENSSGSRMNFPADDATKTLFDEEGIPVSKANVWAVEVRPTVFRYELSRPERFFQVEFDTNEATDRD